MRKILSLVTALVASVAFAYADPFAEVVVPATTLDFYNPAMVEEVGWYSSVQAYWLDQNVLITSGYESYRSVGTQTWMTQQSAGSSTSTWDALPPFRGSNFYKVASYATLQEDRYIAYRVTNCDSVWAYGYNSAASKYLYMEAYEVSNPETASLNPATDTKISTDNSAAGGKGTGVMKLNLDASKTYVIVVSGTGNSNSRLFEIAFFRKPGGFTKTYYTVAGDSKPLFGTTWDPSNAANDMVNEPTSGLYVWSRTEKKLNAGKVEFKVVKDHDWGNGNWPSQNKTFDIPEMGIYTVVITFNEESKDITVEATKTGDAEVTPQMDVKGEWDTWAIHDLAISEDELTAAVEVEIAAPGLFEFGLDQDGVFIANAATVSRNANKVEGLEGNTGNMKLDADQAGTYRFEWTYATRTLVVTFPKKEANLDDYDLAYTWNGKKNGEAAATSAVQQGGTAAAYGGNSNIVVGTAQKTNWVIKLGKGWENGVNFVGITLDQPLAEGDLLEIAAFRTSDKSGVFGIDFCADAEDGANAVGQIILPDNLQQLSDNVAPADEYWPVPKEAAGKKFIRLYRYSGSTTVWVANFSVYRLKGVTPPPQPETKPLYLEPGVWASDNAVLAAWAWKTGAEGAWAKFEPTSQEGRYVANVAQDADMVKIVRFAAGVEPAWEGVEKWNETGDMAIEECGLLFITDWNHFFWCELPGSDMEIRLVPGPWNVDGQKFAAVTLNYIPEDPDFKMETILADAVFSDWFVSEGEGVFNGRIPTDTKIIAFGCFSADTETPSIIAVKSANFKHHSDILVLDPSMKYTIDALETADKDYCAGHWGDPEPPTAVYTVAGGLTTDGGIDDPVFGKAWEPTLADNDMALKDGIFVWEKENLELYKGQQILFKVVKNHAWTETWPEQNKEVPVAEDGKYTLKISFNPESKEVSAELTKTGDIEPRFREITFVPGAWADIVEPVAGEPFYAAWAWIPGADGEWYVIQSNENSLVARIPADKPNILFVRFPAGTEEPSWDVPGLIQTSNQEIQECGIFYINDGEHFTWCEPYEPQPEFKEIIFVPGAWDNIEDAIEGSPLYAAWAWIEGAEGDWYPVLNNENGLIAHVPGDVTHIIFVRFPAGTEEPSWDLPSFIQTPNQMIEECAIFFVNDGEHFTWCEPYEPQPEFKEIIFVPGAWTEEGALFAAWAWTPEGIGSWYVLQPGPAGLIARIPSERTQILFARFPAGTEEPSWEVEGMIQTPDQEIQECGIFYINDGEHFTWCEPYIGPVYPKQLHLVPGPWTVDDAVLVAWAWGGNIQGQWFPFEKDEENEGLLVAFLAEEITGLKVVRFPAGTKEFSWEQEIWDQTGDLEFNECAVLYLNDWNHFTWCEPLQPVSEWDEIVFTEADVASAGETAKRFVCPSNAEFILSLTDLTDKISIDANNANFGTPEDFTKYNYRLKSGGKSQIKDGEQLNMLTLSIPAEGKLRIAVRTGSNSATDRNLVIKQGDGILYDAVVQEADKITIPQEEGTLNIYPYITVDVEAGDVYLEYPTGSLNFYAFAFHAVEPQPEMAVIRLVPNVWNIDGAKFAAVSMKEDLPQGIRRRAALEGEDDVMAFILSHAVISDWFVDKGEGIFEGSIPADAQIVAFGRFSPDVEVITEDVFTNPELFWNHSDRLNLADATPEMTYQIDSWEQEGKNFCPGHWLGGPEPEVEWFLAGDMTAWQEGKLSFAEGPITCRLEKGIHPYKIIKTVGADDQWFGNAGIMTRDNHEGWVFEASIGDNCQIDADKEGDYIFSIVINEDGNPVVSVTYPDSGQGFEHIAAEGRTVKVIHNGQLLILRGDKIFNAQGAIVK